MTKKRYQAKKTPLIKTHSQQAESSILTATKKTTVHQVPSYVYIIETIGEKIL